MKHRVLLVSDMHYTTEETPRTISSMIKITRPM